MVPIWANILHDCCPTFCFILFHPLRNMSRNRHAAYSAVIDNPTTEGIALGETPQAGLHSTALDRTDLVSLSAQKCRYVQIVEVSGHLRIFADRFLRCRRNLGLVSRKCRSI